MRTHIERLGGGVVVVVVVEMVEEVVVWSPLYIGPSLYLIKFHAHLQEEPSNQA